MLGDPNNKDGMHPEDMRNLFIFFAAAVLLWLAYDFFILQPQNAALQRAQQARLQKAQQESVDAPGQTASGDQAVQDKPRSREEVLKETRRISFENEAIYGSLSVRGGRIDDLNLHEHFDTLKKKNNVSLLSPKGTGFSRIIDYGWVSNDKETPLPDKDTPWQVRGSEKLGPDSPITLEWDNGQGLLFRRTIALDTQYMFTVKQSVTNNSGRKITLYPYGIIAQKGEPVDFTSNWLLHEGPIGYIGESLREVDYSDLKDGKTERIEAQNGWTGITEKYWLTSLVPPQGQMVKYGYKHTPDDNVLQDRGTYQIDFVGAPLVLQPGQSGENVSHAFIGAKELLQLNAYAEELNIPRFDLAVDFGWFWFLAKPFFYALHFLGGVLGNVGLAIIVLTILIRSSVFPLTNASYKSFAKMKQVTPQVVKLRETYKDDKEKMQQELVKLYQDKGVNPMAGCFPMLLQIPIFFALYKVLYVTIEMRHEPFFGWIRDLSAPDPTNIFTLFGLVPWNTPDFLHFGALPCAMLLVLLVQRKLNPPPQDPIQRDMMRIMPFFMTFIMARFASGLVLYWTFSAMISVIQQMIIMRSMNMPIYLLGQSPDEKALDEAVKDGPSAHPLTDMIEDDVEESMFGEHDDEPETVENISPPKPKKGKNKGKPRKSKGKK